MRIAGASMTFGIVLNRSTEITAPNLCSTLEIDWHGDSDEVIDWGGPVQPQTGWVIFGEDLDVEEVEEVKHLGEGVHFAGSLEILKRVADDPPAKLRLLLGYAGWGPGQLDSELSEGAWLVAPLHRDVVFDVDPDAMRGAVQEVVEELEATTIKDMGRVMGVLKERYAGRMDFGKASALVKNRLA